MICLCFVVVALARRPSSKWLEAARKGQARRWLVGWRRRVPSPALLSSPPHNLPLVTLRRDSQPTTYAAEEQHRSPSALGPPYAMLARLPFLTATETAAASAFFPSCDSLIPPNLGLLKKKHGTRLNIQPNITCGKTQGTSGIHKKWRALSSDPSQAAVVDAGDSKTWQECQQILTSLNFSTEDAEKMLKKAFGWIHSPYWTEERKKEVPSVEVISGVLNYIRGLGLSDNDLCKLLKKFPEVLGCDLESEVKLNVGKLDSDWKINGKTLRSVLLRNPKVLGYNVDCRGDCAAQCTRCWVRF